MTPQELADVVERAQNREGYKTMNDFGNLLKTYRERAKLSQSKLAEIADFDHSYLSRLESGKRNPTRAAVERLAKELELEGEDYVRFLALAGFVQLGTIPILHCPGLVDLDMAYVTSSPTMKIAIESAIGLITRGAQL